MSRGVWPRRIGAPVPNTRLVACGRGLAEGDLAAVACCVRRAHFLGGKDPFERLKTALRAEIDEDAWATL
jgi:hypothetical protein